MSSTAKIVERIFGDELVQFKADNVALNQVKIRSMAGAQSNRNEAKQWYPKPAIGVTEDGLDLTGKFQEFTNLSVPEVVDTYTSYPFKLTNTDTLDEFELQQQIRAGMQAIGARINRAVANVVYQQGALTITSVNGSGGTPLTFADIVKINSAFTRNDIDVTTPKTLIMNVEDYNSSAADLALRDTLNKGSIAEGAFKEAFVNKIANLKVFQTSFSPAVAAQGAVITVNGANQNVIPTAFQLTTLGNIEDIDNRSQNLIVSATAGIIPGDKFTMTGVFEVSMINKLASTVNLRTFTVKSVVNGTTLEISPQIVVEAGTLTSIDDKAQNDYANVTAAPANLASLTFLNANATISNLFWENESIVLDVAPVVDEKNIGGMIISNMTLSMGANAPGLNFILAKQGDINDLSSKWRLTTRFGANNREPEKNGTFLTNQ